MEGRKLLNRESWRGIIQLDRRCWSQRNQSVTVANKGSHERVKVLEKERKGEIRVLDTILVQANSVDPMALSLADCVITKFHKQRSNHKMYGHGTQMRRQPVCRHAQDAC